MFGKLNTILGIIILMFGLIFIQSCTDDEDEPLGYYTISDEFKSYTLFKANSYWVYENEKNSTVDTIVIDSILSYIGVNGLDPDNNVKYKYKAFESFIKNPNIMDYNKWEISATNNSRKQNNMTALFRLYFSDSYYIVFQPFFNFGEIIHIGGISGDYQNVELIQAFNVGGTIFNNVYHTRTYDSIIPDQPRMLDFYVAKNYGIVRQEIKTQTDTVIWNLISWSLNQ